MEWVTVAFLNDEHALVIALIARHSCLIDTLSDRDGGQSRETRQFDGSVVGTCMSTRSPTGRDGQHKHALINGELNAIMPCLA